MKPFAPLLFILTLPHVASAASPIDTAHGNATTLTPDIARRCRFMSMAHMTPEERKDMVAAVAWLSNSLSRAPEPVHATAIAVDMLRVNLDDYGWSVEVWEKQLDNEPYFHVRIETEQPYGNYDRYGRWRTTEVVKERQVALAPWIDQQKYVELVAMTGSQVPVVRADWWFINSVRQLNLRNKETGHGYYDWLGLKDRAAYERLIKLNADDSRELQKEMRAAVQSSGVSDHNRQIVRLKSLTGGAWATLDTDDDTDEGNAIRNIRRGDYKHKAEEHYGVLSNGLFVYFLCDAEGKRQELAPDFIGGDKTSTSNDTRIHVCLACARCHVEGLRPIDDWARRNEKTLELQFADYAVSLEIKRQYLSNLTRQLIKDRDVYAEALADCNGLTPEENAALIRSVWQRWADTPRTLEMAAREMGCGPVVLKAVLGKTPNIDPVLGGLLSGPVKVTQWEEVFPIGMLIVTGHKP